MPGIPLPPISAGGGKSDSALNAAGSLYHASGDGDWVTNFAGSGGGGFGGFGGFGGSASSGFMGASAGSGLVGSLTASPLLLVAALGVAWLLLKK
jgi:hypothetical protein